MCGPCRVLEMVWPTEWEIADMAAAHADHREPLSEHRGRGSAKQRRGTVMEKYIFEIEKTLPRLLDLRCIPFAPRRRFQF
jgi:hypothetical protein